MRGLNMSGFGDLKKTWPVFTMDMSKGITQEELDRLTDKYIKPAQEKLKEAER